MKFKQNPLTGDWLCYISGTSQAYYYSNKKDAKKFCDRVNKAYENGEWAIENGEIKIIKAQ